MSWQLYPSKKGEQRRYFRTVFAVAVFVIIIALVWQVLPSNAKQSVREVLSVPLIETASIRMADPISYLQTNNQLCQENQQLRQLLREQEALVNRAQVLERNNERLSALLGKETFRDFIYADVIAGGDQSHYNTVLINRGVASGIEPGDMVYFDTTIPVAVVIDARENSSLVRFFSHPSETVSVVIGENNLRATAQGAGAGTLVATFPNQVEIESGEVVRFLGPSGAETFGLVQRVERDDGSSARVYIALLVNPARILHLQIAK